MSRSGLKISCRSRDCPGELARLFFLMASCAHITLELLPTRKRTVRCRQCHLTLDAVELGDGHCPECFERSGRRHYEFDELETGDGTATYRCEECGALVKCQ